MRWLAVDLGDKRTGLAVGDDETGFVSPAGVIETPIAREEGGALLRDLAAAIDEYGPDGIVVGLPLNMDGTEGPRAAMVRAFGARLHAASGLEVAFHDERLSTEAARWEMAGSGLTRGKKKALKDSLAAAGVLRDFLAERGRRSG